MFCSSGCRALKPNPEMPRHMSGVSPLAATNLGTSQIADGVWHGMSLNDTLPSVMFYYQLKGTQAASLWVCASRGHLCWINKETSSCTGTRM